ncbi:hypothetical protein CRG98_020572 [Punica granatum]|uniref:Uncharacterized protein n=1 Tax=Punica granatum TaxID=22663 RepID=A0A2I0JRT1_PUNGR|nr:hypothetical protein CRG98_020572 [Punica granatum]
MALGNDRATTNGSQTTGSGHAPILPNHLVSQNMAAPSMVPVNHVEKPEKFNGLNFKRWQQKMLFYLTTLNLARFLTENAPTLSMGESDVQALSADFKNYLKHNPKEMTMEDLVVKLRIEEDNKNSGNDLILPAAKVNVMEQ